jgi:hypothetical protein
VGGALIGKKIAQDNSKRTAWVAAYALYDGTKGEAEFDHDPGLKAGDKIEYKDGKLNKR